MADYVGEQVQVGHVIALAQKADIFGQAQARPFLLQFIQEMLFAGFCATHNNAVAIRPRLHQLRHHGKEVQLAFPAGNPPRHHDDFFAGKLRILTEPAVQPLLWKLPLMKGIHIHTSLDDRQFFLGNRVIVHHVIPHALGDCDYVIGAGHDGAVGCYRVHAVEG